MSREKTNGYRNAKDNRNDIITCTDRRKGSTYQSLDRLGYF